MQNLFICKFSALKIQFFPPVSVLPSSRTPLSSHPPRHPASFLVGTRLLDLGGTRVLVYAAWYGEGLADEPNGMCAAFRTGKPGVAERNAQCRLFGSGECGLSRTIIIFGDCAGGRLLSNLYPEKVLPRRLRAQNLFEACAHQTDAGPLLGRERTIRSQNPCWGENAPDGRRTLWGESAPYGRRTLIGARMHQTVAEPLLGRERTRRSQNPYWSANADCGRRTL